MCDNVCVTMCVCVCDNVCPISVFIKAINVMAIVIGVVIVMSLLL